MRTWLDECEAEQRICNPKFFDSSLRRLLNVSPRSPNGIRLVENAGLGNPAYVALSHCWGDPTRLLKIVTQKYQDRISDIPLTCLSKTFRDAVQICRHIGQQYLCIDAFCIIQDNKTDWESESAVMGAIYRGAYVNLSLRWHPPAVMAVVGSGPSI
jgi:hypothetical protein